MCYGFEILQECKSPRHPFQIFRTQFLKPPNVIVYDNACSLHQYCLNREPEFFKSTCFFVDHFHWKGHVGCIILYFYEVTTSIKLPNLATSVKLPKLVTYGIAKIGYLWSCQNWLRFIPGRGGQLMQQIKSRQIYSRIVLLMMPMHMLEI